MLARIWKSRKVSNFGTVLLYDDFVSYKASLGAIKKSQTVESQRIDWNSVGKESKEQAGQPAGRKLDTLLRICPVLAADELQVPDSCVDRTRVKQEGSVR